MLYFKLKRKFCGRRKVSGTLRSQIEEYTRILIFRNFSSLSAVIWVYPFIKFQENFQPPHLSKPSHLSNFKKISCILGFYPFFSLAYIFSNFLSLWLCNRRRKDCMLIGECVLGWVKFGKFWNFKILFHPLKDMNPRVSKLGLDFFYINSGISAGRFKICLINPICVCIELKSK